MALNVAIPSLQIILIVSIESVEWQKFAVNSVFFYMALADFANLERLTCRKIEIEKSPEVLNRPHFPKVRLN